MLREWVRREARKAECPDAEPTGWSRDRLVSELTATSEEPAEPLGEPSVADDFPEAAQKVAWFAAHIEDRSFGATVAWQREGEWPPVLLDGNHRACGAHRATREGAELAVELHLGRVTPPE